MSDFRTDLDASRTPEINEMMDTFCRNHFPGFAFRLINDNDNEAQRRGIDSLVYLGGDKFVRIEEKIDFHNPVNFFLEYISVDRTQAPGWVEKNMVADFVAYAFVQHSTCYFLPWSALQRAWKIHANEWKSRYPPRTIQNKNYNTIGLAVPIPVVLQALTSAMLIKI